MAQTKRPRKPSPKKAAKKPAAKKAPTKKPAKRPAAKATAPAPPPPSAPGKSVRPRRPAGAPPIERTRVVTAGAAPPRTKTRVLVQKTRVVMPMDFYEPHKDEIKAPIKAAEAKWTFLGEGKGLYKRADGGVHAFTQFKDDGVHYSVWGADKKAVAKLLGAWEALLGPDRWAKATARGEEAVAAEAQEKESEALKLWKLAEPQRRAGEPDLFYNKRKAEWEAKKPAS